MLSSNVNECKPLAPGRPLEASAQRGDGGGQCVRAIPGAAGRCRGDSVPVAEEAEHRQVAAGAPHRGRAVQVDPMQPKLKPPGTKSLKLKYDALLSNFCFKFISRRYIVVLLVRHSRMERAAAGEPVDGRGLHSSTSQLNLSSF